MNKNSIIATVVFAMVAIIAGCRGKEDTGRAYMPDMAYSRAYETYAQRSDSMFTMDPNNKGHKIFYNNSPVSGTIKRGELFPYTIANDSVGVKLADGVKSPLAPISADEMKETGRLYNINCGVCHGAKGEGNGPLATSGKVGGIKSLVSDAAKGYTDGRLFHIITYGQNNMGSYASQLNRKQRWEIIQYVRSLQGVGAAAPSTSGATKAIADTAKTTKGK